MTKGGPHTGKERKGKERKGKERKGKERKGKERKGKERKGKERKGKERKDEFAHAAGGYSITLPAATAQRCRRLQHTWRQLWDLLACTGVPIQFPAVVRALNQTVRRQQALRSTRKSLLATGIRVRWAWMLGVRMQTKGALRFQSELCAAMPARNMQFDRNAPLSSSRQVERRVAMQHVRQRRSTMGAPLLQQCRGRTNLHASLFSNISNQDFHVLQRHA